MSDEIVLYAGAAGDEETGEGYEPRIELAHAADRDELFILVGEETAGMVECISSAAFEAIRRRLDRPPLSLSQIDWLIAAAMVRPVGMPDDVGAVDCLRTQRAELTEEEGC